MVGELRPCGLLLPLLLTGCYSIGFEPQEELGSGIAVPIFKNETLRRNVEHDLTRRVRREVLQTTPLRLRRESSTGAVLRGTVREIREAVLIAGPRQEVLYAGLTVSVDFGVYRGDALVLGDDTDGNGTPDREITAIGYAEFDSSRGESRDTATAEALVDVAEMIVLSLRRREDDRLEPNDSAAEATRLEPGNQVALIQRNPDWFRVKVPARHALHAVWYSGDSLQLDALDAQGRPLPGVESRDQGRILDFLAGDERGHEVLLRITGKDTGARYQLLARVLPDDDREPDDVPEQATLLALGKGARGIQRNDDHLRVELPKGAPLVAQLGPKATPSLRLQLVDKTGAPLLTAQVSKDGRRATLPADPKPRTVYVRVSGDGEGRQYELTVE